MWRQLLLLLLLANDLVWWRRGASRGGGAASVVATLSAAAANLLGMTDGRATAVARMRAKCNNIYDLNSFERRREHAFFVDFVSLFFCLYKRRISQHEMSNHSN